MTRKRKSKRKKYKQDVAISFAGEDRDIAKKLASKLKRKGISTFYDEDHKSYLWGKKSGVFDSIYGPESRFVITLVSENYAKKDWTQYEFSVAKAEAKKREDEFILPIRIDDTRLLGLHDDLSYMDIRQDSLDLIAGAVVKKCQRALGEIKTSAMYRNSQIEILPHSIRHMLGIIAFSAFPINLLSYKKIFPNVNWSSGINVLMRKGLLLNDKETFRISQKIKNIFFKDTKDIGGFNRTWIDALEPLKEYPDIGIMLSMNYFNLGKFDDAVSISANVVEGMGADWWSSVYLTFFKAVSNNKFLRQIRADTKVKLYNAMGLCLSHIGKNDEAIEWFLKLRRFSVKYKNAWGLGQSYINCGVIYYRIEEKAKAKTCYQNAIIHGQKTKDDILLSHSLNNLAYIVANESTIDAERLLKESIAIKQKNKDYTGLVASYGALGYLYANDGDYAKAKRTFLQTYEKAKKLELIHDESMALHNLGTLHIEMQEYDTAISYYKKLYKIAKGGFCDDVEVMALEGEAKANFELGRFKRAERKFRQLYNFEISVSQKKKNLVALEGISVSLINQKRWQEARKTLDKTLVAARKCNAHDLIARMLFYKALTYQNGEIGENSIKFIKKYAIKEQKSKRYNIALQLWNTSIHYLKNLPENSKLIYKVFEDGSICVSKLSGNHSIKFEFFAHQHSWLWEKGQYQAAIDILRKYEKVAEKAQLLSEKAKAIDQRGVCLQELEQYEEAELAHKEALRIAMRIKNKFTVQFSLHNLGEVFRRTNRLSKAIKSFIEAEEISRSICDYESEISTAHNRALALEQKGNINEAEELLIKCRDIAKRKKIWREYVRAWEALGNHSWCNNRQSLAVKRLKKALSEAKELEQYDLQPEIALNLARVLYSEEETHQALAILNPYKHCFNSILNAHDYYGTLGLLHEQTGDLDLAMENYQIAMEMANRIGDKDSLSYYNDVLLGISKGHNKPKLSEIDLKKALANEDDPETITTLLFQRLEILLEKKKESEAEEIFNRARSLASEYNLNDLYIDMHMLIGDYYWEGNYEEKLNGMRAYFVAMGHCFLDDSKTAGSIGAHIMGNLIDQSEELICRMEKDISDWLQKESEGEEYVINYLCWPFRVAKKSLPYRRKPRLIGNVIDKAIKEELLQYRC